MREVVRGTNPANIAKALGRFGFSEGQATSMLLSSLGIAGGAALGTATGIGAAPLAVAVPVLGQAFRKMAQTLTRRNAEFASALTRAGKNSFEIARAYSQTVPRSQQSIEELAGILLERGATLAPARIARSSLLSNAAFLASYIQNAPAEAEPKEPEAPTSPRPSPASVGAVTADRLP
jgi:hypothetical protein